MAGDEEEGVAMGPVGGAGGASLGEVDVSEQAYLVYTYVILFGDEARPKDRDGNTYAESSKEIASWKERGQKRKDLVSALKAPHTGLSVARRRSSDKDASETYILIVASEARMEAEAERRGLVMQMKGKWGGGFAEFTVATKHRFRGSKKQFFRHSQMMWLTDSIIQAEVERGGAGINIEQAMRHGIVTKYYGLHNTPKRKELIQIWAKKFFSRQPLDSVRNYFGEEIALYFAWLGFYTKWLWVASIPGTIAFIWYTIDKWGSEPGEVGASIWAVTAYSIFLALWATFFMEYWKRFQYSLAWKWGMLDFEATEHARPDFKGIKRNGTYHNGEWIPFSQEDAKLLNVKPEDLPEEKYSPKTVMYAKMAVIAPMAATLVTACLVGTFAILALRLFMQYNRNLPFIGAIIGGGLNAIFIIMANFAWKVVAIKLTSFENHRTQTEWDDSFLIKNFLFQFVNSYSSLYYLAFFKKGFLFFGDTNLTDDCRTGQLSYNVVSYGCLDELTLQLASLLLVNMFIGQAREVIMPWAWTKMQLLLLARNTDEEEKEKSFPQWEKESKLFEFEGVFDEYNEMVLQYGYVVLFTAAFPIAALLAVLNNIVEIRTDALKLLTGHPRPHYKGAADIGGWEAILEVLGVMGVITNTLLIGFSFESVRNVAFGNDAPDENSPEARANDFAIFAAVVILEHFLLGMKYIIAFFVPDSPGWVRKELARQEYVNAALVKQLEEASVKPPKSWGVRNDDSDSDNDDDDDDDEGAGAGAAAARKKGKQAAAAVEDEDESSDTTTSSTEDDADE